MIPVGTRVIVRSNEDEPIKGGILVRYEQIHSATIPVVQFEDDGKLYMCMGIVRPYSDELMTTLFPMTPKEQWDHLRHKDG